MVPNLFDRSFTIYGMPVVVTPDYPKMVLSEDVPVSPEFRREINLWMLGFFGTTNTMEDGQVVKAMNHLYMNPRTYHKVREAFAHEQRNKSS